MDSFKPTHDLTVVLSNGNRINIPVMKDADRLVTMQEYAWGKKESLWTLSFNTAVCYRGVAVVCGRTVIDDCLVIECEFLRR